MNKITEITRRDIFELFKNGRSIEWDFFGNEINRAYYRYHGRLSEIEFLKKLYPLDTMPSSDVRFENAERDIWQHTINNSDWEEDWIFYDDRFELFKGSDIILLEFLCTIFYPTNRYEEGYWYKYLEIINNFIKKDGYELYDNGEKISGRTVYSWRKITPEESASRRFIPFSIRNKKELEAKSIILPKIPKKVRTDFLNLFRRFDEIWNKTDETGYNYSTSTIEVLIKEDIREYYPPKAFDSTKKYSETNDLEQFIMSNYPHCVFDAIELFAQYNRNNNFTDEVNLLFQNNGFDYKLLGGKIGIAQINFQTKEIIKEPGLKELVEHATSLYRSDNISDKQIAVEKLWDAFERLKTYYSSLDKKKSAEKLVNDISNGNNNYIIFFNEEFLKLTVIGNQFRIRHHETDKIDIADINYFDYFYRRCFALIDLALKYLK